jgi:hypothetical protein
MSSINLSFKKGTLVHGVDFCWTFLFSAPMTQIQERIPTPASLSSQLTHRQIQKLIIWESFSDGWPLLWSLSLV